MFPAAAGSGRAARSPGRCAPPRSRRSAPSGAGSWPVTSPEEGAPVDLHEATIVELQAAIAAGRLTSAELTRHFLQRIETYDRGGPHLNAVLEVNPEALEIAEALDREHASTGPRGSLHGIPVLLKDNICTADRLHTSAGSLAFKDVVALRDAFLVTRLREAGAVILGKANMTEWANFMTTGMPAGYSSRGGQVANPYGTGLSPGGSSSGSAVAVAAGLCTVAVGTETSGSILSPAHHNSVVGIKPTLGLVSRPGSRRSRRARTLPGRSHARSRTRRRSSARWPASTRATASHARAVRTRTATTPRFSTRGRPGGRAAGRILRAPERRRGPRVRGRPPRAPRPGRDRDRSRRHPDGSRGGRLPLRRDALRVQARPEPVSRRARRGLAHQVPARPHPLQRSPAARDAALRPDPSARRAVDERAQGADVRREPGRGHPALADRGHRPCDGARAPRRARLSRMDRRGDRCQGGLPERHRARWLHRRGSTGRADLPGPRMERAGTHPPGVRV